MSNQRGSLVSVANELNVSSDNIKRWNKEFNQGKLTGKTTPVRSKEEEEVIRLRKELADVKMDRDILFASAKQITTRISLTFHIT